jgi:hypothetical protein
MEKEWLDMGIDDVEKDCLESKTSDPKMLTCGGGTVSDLPLWRPARSRCGVCCNDRRMSLRAKPAAWDRDEAKCISASGIVSRWE